MTSRGIGLVKDHAVLIRNRRAVCDRCGAAPWCRIAVLPEYERFMVYTASGAMVCVRCAAAIAGISQKAVMFKLRPHASKIYAHQLHPPHRIWTRGEDGKLHHVQNPELKRKR